MSVSRMRIMRAHYDVKQWHMARNDNMRMRTSVRVYVDVNVSNTQ